RVATYGVRLCQSIIKTAKWEEERMEVIHITQASEQFNKEAHVMAIGFFDGVHLGHQELLNHAKSLAEKNNVLFTALTFSPHPDEVIKGDKNRKYITPLPQKIEKMRALGVDKLFVMTFDKAFASLPPADFINYYIINTHTKHVVVGFDFTFGLKAEGDTLLLRKQSKKQSFGLSVIPKKTYRNEKISSTLLRRLIGDGEVDRIPFYLGANYQVKIETGKKHQTGSQNVRTLGSYILPKAGIYFVKISDGRRTVQGEFHRYAEKDNEIVAPGLQALHGEELSILFLSKVSAASVVSV